MTKKTNYLLLSVIILGIIFLLINGYSLAKYASDSVWNYYLKSKGFYFSSDDLQITTIKNVNNVWTGESIYFNLKNSSNNLLISEFDIDYVATCNITTEGVSASCYMNGTTSNTYNGKLSSYQRCVNNKNDGIDTSLYNKSECDIKGYDYINEEAVADLYFDIANLNEDVTDLTVNVTVKSISPYQKTLTGDFILHVVKGDNEEISFKVNNYEEYSDLIITNSYSKDKCINISFDSNKIIFDGDINSISSYTSDENNFVNGIKTNIVAKNSINYSFYSINNEIEITKDSFTLTEIDECN